MGEFPFFLTFLGLMAVLVVFAMRTAAARQREQAKVLEPLGFSLVERHLARSTAAPFRGLFPGWETAVYRRETNDGEELVVGAAQRQGKHTYNYTLYVRRLRADLPSFRLRPEGVLDKVAAAVGFNDIDIEESPEFSRAFHLSGGDREAILDLFSDGICLALAGQRRLRVASEDGWLVVHDWRLHPPARIVDFLEWAGSAADLFDQRP